MSQIGKLRINGKDAYTTWGVYLLDGGVSALMTPPSAKPLVTNKSRLQHGKRVTRTNPGGSSLTRVEDRDVSLPFGLSADNRTQLNTRHEAFIAELQAGEVELEVAELPSVVYHLDFVSCTSFGQYATLAKYVIRFNEPNPKDRT